MTVSTFAGSSGSRCRASALLSAAGALVLVAASWVGGYGQENPSPARDVDYVLNARVDTSDTDVRDIAALWRDYLESRHDGADGRQYWRQSEVERWDAFNLFAPHVFQHPRFLDLYGAVVMSIEPEGENLYGIRTLFYSETLEPPFDRLNPWAIVRLYAARDSAGEHWQLRNALGVMTERWRRSTIRFVTFVYPETHQFDLSQAARSVAFCDSIVEAFPFFTAKPFEFYVTDSAEALDRILGIDYCVTGFVRGRALPGHRLLLTSNGTEWSPHELVHMVVGIQSTAHPTLIEGVAGWIGGWLGGTYRDNMTEAARWLEAHPDVTFDDLIREGGEYELPGKQYVPGAVLCEIVWMKTGSVGLQRLFAGGSSREDLYETIEEILGVGTENFQFMWRTRVRELR